MFVAKFRGAGQGVKALIAELIAGQLAAAAGLPTPDIALIEVPDSFGRSEPGERALAAARGAPPPLTQPVGPGGAYETMVVFDLPTDARDLRLYVTDGFWAERLVELFLIGDEDSILHSRTSFRLET